MSGAVRRLRFKLGRWALKPWLIVDLHRASEQLESPQDDRRRDGYFQGVHSIADAYLDGRAISHRPTADAPPSQEQER